MQAVIGEVFGLVVEYLVEQGYVKLEEYFVDGTKIEADGNKHKVVWAKRKERYEKRVKDQILRIDSTMAEVKFGYLNSEGTWHAVLSFAGACLCFLVGMLVAEPARAVAVE